jgi:4-amino-4-deoxy-L-arabinose transferase-like glycosyltransferase
MAARTVTVLSIALLAVAGVLLYATRLGEVPAYVMHDEAQGALQAHAIATTGRDLSGRRWPMYFTEPEFPPGRDPALIYVTALALQVLPFDERGVRMATALIAVLNVILTFVVGRRLFNSAAMGLAAGALLLLTPVHFIRGRMLLSPLYTIPFILLWLWLLARFVAEPSTRRLSAAAVALGAGAYSYLAAVVMMPLYLLATLLAGWRRLGVKAALIAASAFAATLIPMVLWYLTHPERNQQIVSAYQLDATTRSPLARWIGLYWSFFDPSFLFLTGDASVINSTRSAGFFPMAFALLLPVGLAGLVRARQPLHLAIAAGFVTAPLVSIISGAVEMNRIMFAIPFGVLAAAYGAWMLVTARSIAVRTAGVLLLASVPLQFASLYSNYMGGYRLSSAPWFAGSAREAVRATMTHAQADANPIYVSAEIDWVHRTWRFYAIADRRLQMIDRARFVLAPPAEAAPGSLFLCLPASAHCRPSPPWQAVETVSSIDGSRTFSILRQAAAPAP